MVSITLVSHDSTKILKRKYVLGVAREIKIDFMNIEMKFLTFQGIIATPIATHRWHYYPGDPRQVLSSCFITPLQYCRNDGGLANTLKRDLFYAY